MQRSELAILRKTFANPGLPLEWSALENVAYSRAYLRMAGLAYIIGETHRAQESLAQSLTLDPELAEEEVDELVGELINWVRNPMAADPRACLDAVKSHLPEALDTSPGFRRRLEARYSLAEGFERHSQGDLRGAGRAFLRAGTLHPGYLRDRGVISILARAAVGNRVVEWARSFVRSHTG